MQVVAGAKVTVLMPVRDGARWLDEAIASVRAQTLPDFELLAVDDGSTDATPDILARHAGEDGRLRILRQERAGLVAALNAGIAEAATPLIARLDADDACAPARLERQVRFMNAHPGIGLLGSWAKLVDEHGNPTGKLTPARDHAVLLQQMEKGNPFVHSSTMFRTEAVRAVGGYRGPFEAAEDYDLWLRIAESADIANLPELLVRYRRHGAGVTGMKAARQALSVRLAKRSRQARADGKPDPASALHTSPDFFSPDLEATLFADDMRVARFLAFADASLLHQRVSCRIDLDEFRKLIPGLSHGERRLAQQAVCHLLRWRDRPSHLKASALWTLLFRLHPPRALAAGWRVFRGGDAK